MLKAVVDTNVFVSALLGSRTNISLYEAFRRRRFTLILSPELLAEMIEVLNRPEFRIPSYRIVQLVELIGHQAEIVTPTVRISDCRDPKDNMVLECASAGGADYIVTGDKDLLSMNPYRGISIVTVSEFSAALRPSK